MIKKLSIIMFICFLTGCTNTWSDFGTDIDKAAQVAGFSFPLALSNYKVRATKGAIEIAYPLDGFRTVKVTKSMTECRNSGNNYPVNGIIKLKNGVSVYASGDGNKVYVMNVAASNGYYTAVCSKGMSLDEIEGIYALIAKAESPKNIP